jgi:predicted MFS family arabinose efflux permease
MANRPGADPQPTMSAGPQADGSGAGEAPGGAGLVWSLSAAQLVSWGALYYTFAVVSGPIGRDLGWDKATVNGAWSVGLLITALCALPVGGLLDRLGGQLVMTAGTILGAAFLALWSGVGHIATLYLALAGLGLAMSATLYEAGFAVLTRRFPLSYRTQITRMTLIGGLAPTVFVPITGWLVEALGWRAALLALAGITLAIGLPVHALMLKENDAGAMPARGSDAYKTNAAISNAALKRALRHPTFWALLVTFMVHATLASAILFHIIPLLQERGFAGNAITAAYMLIGPAQVGGRLVLMALGRHVKTTTAGLLTVLALPMALGMLIALPSSNATMFAVLAIYGVGNGLITIIRGTSVPDLLGADGYGAINGAFTLPSRVGGALAPVAVALAWQSAGSYGPILWVLLGMAVVGAVSYAVAVYSARTR